MDSASGVSAQDARRPSRWGRSAWRARPTLLLAAALLLPWASGCGDTGSAGRPDPDHGLRVQRGDVEDIFLLTGELRALSARELVTPRTDQWSLALLWLAPEGERVEEGDPVVQFDSSSAITELEDKRLAVAEAEQELERTRLDLEASRREKALEVQRREVALEKARLEAAVPLALRSAREHQDKQIALARARNDLEKATRELETASEANRTRVRELEVRLETARRSLERAEGALETLALRAPVSGVLLHGTHPWEGRKLQVGDTCFPGFVVAEVPELDEMEVEARLSDVDEGEVLPGMPARISLDTFPDRVFRGLVREVAEFAQELPGRSEQRAFRVFVELDQTDPEAMRPGMSTRVEIVRRTWTDVLTAPRETVDLTGDRPRVYLEAGGSEEVNVAWCGPLDCVLEKGPPEGTPLARTP